MTDISELVKRLRDYAQCTETDIDEAADALVAQAREIEKLEEANLTSKDRIEDLEALLKDCADDLEAEIEARYGQSKSHQPLKYACDMVPVIAARAALNGEKASIPEKTDDRT